ncbi:MAG: Stp1/IreP family PP2C-type Ser/Thr phosphatase [Deinococcales bacterium]
MTQSIAPLELSGFTHPGQVRELNEDTWAKESLPFGELFVVADGMGGHRTGEVASSMAIESLLAAMKELNDIPPQSLPRAMQRSNLSVFQYASRRAESRGMGTTMTAVVIDGNAAVIGHVGDSRAYLIRNNRIEQLTRDHSWVAERVRQGLLSEEEARDHKWRNVITNALGSRPQLRLDLFGLNLLEGDMILVCSDGLSNLISDRQMLQVAQEYSYEPVEMVTQTLVSLANAAGGYDNITCVVARVKRLMPRSKPYPLPQLPRDDSYASDLPEDPTGTVIYEGDVLRRRPWWLIPLVVILYLLLFVVLLVTLRR